jgi:outer membrane lipoprotein LolB
VKLSHPLVATVLAAPLLLTACASRQPVYTNPTLPAQWEAEGKAAVRGPERGTNVYFTWTQLGERYRIIVRGPLGLGRAELLGEPGLVRLAGDNIPEEVSANSLEELLEKATQRQAPVSHALHWMRAEPATSRAEIQRGPDGKILQIRENGWTIQYLEWSPEAPNLPRKLTVSGPDGQATVVIGLWRLRLTPEETGLHPTPPAVEAAP